ncbi:MAG: TolC family protein [Candidatus Thiodiazotropha lotti]|uniref:TolC family protein n=1 Tax=Candidatus Thiodiazotropha lotti TaxID=2792787 RepID=A0A9E4K7Y9_9GAMM|nr:TolC family protein [Candidatus Thiodiazotropha lotti]MCG7940410.1 TolC family protein [Candidatus Thiodiazotropha lotti]MCG7986792.1 TolC family protein [Candidatus Thiodiazotropha lotti]MCG8013130.1 TolC family protein [Candidatus Thiodiazotropha lotti]MCG8021137.1 TolC family protein [Candidatus Thiodiazotropha lotti]
MLRRLFGSVRFVVGRYLPLWFLAAGQTAATEPVSSAAFQSLLLRLQHHPALRVSLAERAHWQANADGSMGLPDPKFTLGLNNLPVNEPTNFDRYLPSSRSLEFMQMIPGLTGRETLRDSHLARADLADLQRQLALAELQLRLVTALAERRRIHASNEALEQQMELLAERERWLRGEMASGASVYGRFDELDVKRAVIDEKKITLAGEAERWQAELRSLLDLVPPDGVLPEIQPRSWTGNPQSLLKIRIELGRLAVARAEVAERNAAFDSDYTISAAWQQREAGENFDGDDWFTLKFTASLPLWSASNQTPKLKAAEARVTKLMAQQEQQLRELTSDYQTALASYRTADQLLTAMAMRQQRLKALEATNRRRYEAGGLDLDGVIRPALQLAEVGLDLAQAKKQRTIAAARINAMLVEENP